MKLELKSQAIKLREQGLPITQIAKQLCVAKSSVSNWVRNVILTQQQIEELKTKNPIYNKQISGAQIKSKKAREKRLAYQNEGKRKAQENNFLHHAGCMLYWAEGSKSKNQCKFTNSDVHMVKLFVRFLRECCGVKNENLTISINCYTNNGLSKSDIENFWTKNLSLDYSNLRKTQENIRPRSATNTIKHNKLLYGIVCITVNSTELVQHIYGAIQEYAQFNNNYMLM
jgi:transposase-like protein